MATTSRFDSRSNDEKPPTADKIYNVNLRMSRLDFEVLKAELDRAHCRYELEQLCVEETRNRAGGGDYARVMSLKFTG